MSTVVRRIVDAMLSARLDPIQEDEVKDRLREVTGTKARALNNTIKKRASMRQKIILERQRRATPSSIPRVLTPTNDAPLREVVRSTDTLLAQCSNQSPPARTVAGIAATVRARPPAGLHLLTGADDEDATPPPSEPLITELEVDELHMMIEDYVTFFAEVKDKGVVVGERDVRLNMARNKIVVTFDTGAAAQLARCRDDFESGIAEATGKALPPFGELSGHIVGKKLQTIESQPVECGDGVLRLRRVHTDPKKGNAYQIEVLG